MSKLLLIITGAFTVSSSSILTISSNLENSSPITNINHVKGQLPAIKTLTAYQSLLVTPEAQNTKFFTTITQEIREIQAKSTSINFLGVTISTLTGAPITVNLGIMNLFLSAMYANPDYIIFSEVANVVKVGQDNYKLKDNLTAGTTTNKWTEEILQLKDTMFSEQQLTTGLKFEAKILYNPK